jgi:predicted Zn-dependent protease
MRHSALANLCAWFLRCLHPATRNLQPANRNSQPLGYLRVCALLLILSVAGASLTSCQVNPVTGEQQFIIIDDQQEIALGDSVAGEVEAQYGGEYRDPALVSYVQQVGGRLASYAERQTVPYRFSVVHSDEVNAFAVPGGRIYVTTGLLARMSNEAQLAAVLGHEIGHVAARDSAVELSRAMGVSVLVQIATSLAAGDSESSENAQNIEAVAGVVYGLISNGFSRDYEYRADQSGMRYMYKAGYNPLAMAQVMQIIQQEGGDKSAIEEFLSTHPSAGKRIDEIEREVRSSYPDVDSNTRLTFGESRYMTATSALRGGRVPAPTTDYARDPDRIGPGSGLKEREPRRDDIPPHRREPESNAATLFEKAEAARMAGNAEEAFDLYSTAIRIDSSRPAYFAGRGLVGVDLDRLSGAESDFKTALKLDKGCTAAHYGLGALYIKKRDFNRARDSLKEAVRQEPASAPAHYFLGEAYLGLNNREKAKSEFEQVVALTEGEGELGQAASEKLAELR